MKIVVLVAATAMLLSGCISLHRVQMGKTTSPRWVSVDNPKERLTPQEQTFLQK